MLETLTSSPSRSDQTHARFKLRIPLGAPLPAFAIFSTVKRIESNPFTLHLTSSYQYGTITP
jgi:hypothetical protein